MDSGTFSKRVPIGQILSNLRVSVGRSDSCVVVVGAEFSLSSSPLTIIELAAVDPSISKSSKMDGKMGYQFQVGKHCPYPLQDLPN